MKYEIVEIIVEQDLETVYKQEFILYPKGSISIIEIPPGVLRSDYSICQIKVKRKGD